MYQSKHPIKVTIFYFLTSCFISVRARMFSAVLGVVFIGMGYGVRPKKAVPTPPPLPETSEVVKPAQEKSVKPRKKVVRKRRAKKKT